VQPIRERATQTNDDSGAHACIRRPFRGNNRPDLRAEVLPAIDLGGVGLRIGSE